MNGKHVYFAIAAILGILTALVFLLPFFLLMIIYLVFLFKYKHFSKQQSGLVFCIFLLFLFVGIMAEMKNTTNIPDSTSVFYLEYMENTKIDGVLLQVIASDKRFKEKLLVRYKIKSEAEKNNLKKIRFFGRICKVSGKLSKPSIAKNPNAFNYRQYLSRKQTFWVLETENLLQTCSPLKKTPLMHVKQLRFNGTNYLEKTFPIEIASLSAALIFGDRSLLDPDILTDYQKTGIVHLLAISGLHVSLLIGMVFYLGLRLGLTREFMTNFLLFLLPIYVVLTGASPSVIRAAMMIFLVLISVKWKRQLKLSPIDAICLALMIYLFFSPMIIFDAGFQLSFAVSFAIILSSIHLFPRYSSYIVLMLVTSIISQLSALPILLYHFYEVSFISIVANLIYIPLFSFIYLPGLYIFFFLHMIFGDLPDFFIELLIKVITVFNEFIEHLSKITFAQFIPGRPNELFLLIYVVLTFMLFVIWEAKPYKKKHQHGIYLLLVVLLFQSTWNWLNPVGEVTMIDVGQGDSILIDLPFRKGTYLIDTGGTVSFPEEEWKRKKKPYEVGRDVVVPFLKGKGITRIDKLILTHGDMDHVGGAFSVITELKVTQLVMPSVAELSETEVSLIQLAKKKGIPVVNISEGGSWKSGKSEFYVLAPEKGYKGERNSGSIALFARVGGLNWFFGGDLDQAGEERIIMNYPQMTIDVLKAGHHGSKTSTSERFINQINPKVVLISAGENNRYGHPHNEVLERLNSIAVFRTDKQGAITYRFYQQKGTFSVYLP
jgi:competence protein ComEC